MKSSTFLMAVFMLVLSWAAAGAAADVPPHTRTAASWVARGVDFYLQGRFPEAVEAFSAAIQKQPRYYQAYAYRGDAWYKQGYVDRALVDYDAALNMAPHYVRAYNSRGYVYGRQGAYARAASDFNRALEIDPAYWAAGCNLAWLLATCPEGDFRDGKKALYWAQKAVDAASNALSLECLAAAYAETGRFRQAVSTQEKAMQRLAGESGNGPRQWPAKRLKAYQSGKPWHEPYVVAGRQPASKAARQRVKPGSDTGRSGNSRSEAAGSSWPYTIQVSSYPRRATSYAKALALRQKGDIAFVSSARIAGKGEWYRIFMGYYRSPAEAEKAAGILKSRRFRHALVMRMPYTVQVGCYGADDEIAAVEARLMSKKHLPYRIAGGGGKCRTRLLIGAFATAADARVVAERLGAQGFAARVVQR